ncbi:MAG: FAD:protein FMN transferase [Anaerolineales bacterium]|nr:FAD:protein FMN transferase [Anaerolineales bacterium]
MVHRLQFRAMGTDMLVCVDNGSEQPPVELADVPNWFEEWEQVLSRFRLTSELSRLNRASGQPIAVSQTLWQVFQSALAAEKNTNGLVTPTVADAMREVGYDRDFSQLAGQTLDPLDSMFGNVSSLDAVSWDEDTRTIYLPKGVRLDFGGIAKGWAAEQVVGRLKHLGSALMNCGGDIAMSGALLDGNPWEIGVFKPFDRSSGYIGMMYFRQRGGVATSATDRRRWMQGSQLRHHIIDPQTGLPAVSDVVSATVTAPTAIEAEAAAKSVLIRGSAAGLEWLESDPDLAALVILENGQILCSQRIRNYL